MGVTGLIALAFRFHATTYGWSETMCGDIGTPVPCSYGAVTASGIEFDPEIPMAAIPAPTEMRMRPMFVWMQIGTGPCVPILVADKAHPRWIGNRGFDLTPAAIRALTGMEPYPFWSGRVRPCKRGSR